LGAHGSNAGGHKRAGTSCTHVISIGYRVFWEADGRSVIALTHVLGGAYKAPPSTAGASADEGPALPAVL